MRLRIYARRPTFPAGITVSMGAVCNNIVGALLADEIAPHRGIAAGAGGVSIHQSKDTVRLYGADGCEHSCNQVMSKVEVAHPATSSSCLQRLQQKHARWYL